MYLVAGRSVRALKMAKLILPQSEKADELLTSLACFSCLSLSWFFCRNPVKDVRSVSEELT